MTDFSSVLLNAVLTVVWLGAIGAVLLVVLAMLLREWVKAIQHLVQHTADRHLAAVETVRR